MSGIPPLPQRKDSLPAHSAPPIPPVPQRKSFFIAKPRPLSDVGPGVRGKSENSKKMSSTSTAAATAAAVDIASETETGSIFEATNHWHNSFKTLYELYESKYLCDVELKIGPKSIKCHRVVLACVSNYFKTMFMSEMTESRQNIITMHDIDIDENAVLALVKFAYTSKITLTVDNVQPLLYASSILQIESVAQACCNFMKDHLHPSNCIGVHNFAEQHGRIELVKMTKEYVLENFQAVLENSEFVNMPYSLIEILVASRDLNVQSEEQVYEGVMKWVKHDLIRRRAHLPKLLANVKLPLMQMHYLKDIVEKDELHKKCFECRDLIDDAKYYQMSLASLLPEVKISERTKPRKSYAGVLFCVGGRGAAGDPFKSIECFDYRKNQWFQACEMNTRRRHVGICAAGKLLYAIGGHDGNEHLSNGEVFNPATNVWTSISPMGTLRRGIALACLGGPIYAVGGLDDNSCFNTVERYDSSSDTWTFLAPMKIPRGGVGLNALKGALYAIGGNDGTKSLNSCERYDPLINKWNTVASMVKRRAGAGVAVLDGIIYAVGGFDDNSPLDSVEKYDPQTDTWIPVQSMSCCRGGVGVATLGGQIFAVGGHDGTNYLNSVEAYDPFTKRWEPQAGVEICRAGAGVAVLDCRVECLTNLKKNVNNSVAGVTRMQEALITRDDLQGKEKWL